MVTIAISFPTSLDALSNPAAGDATNNVTTPHATQHANVNDAVEALEARVGITGSAVTSSLTYRIATLETVLATQGAWSTFTPVVTQPGAITITVTESKYAKVGRIVTWDCTVTFTSAGTAGNVIIFTMPLTAASSTVKAIGAFYANDNGVRLYCGTVVQASTTTCIFITDSTTSGGLGSSPSWAVGNTDTMTFTVTYESAT